MSPSCESAAAGSRSSAETNISFVLTALPLYTSVPAPLQETPVSELLSTVTKTRSATAPPGCQEPQRLQGSWHLPTRRVFEAASQCASTRSGHPETMKTPGPTPHRLEACATRLFHHSRLAGCGAVAILEPDAVVVPWRGEAAPKQAVLGVLGVSAVNAFSGQFLLCACGRTP